MKKLLFVQDVQVVPQKPDRKSEKKHNKRRRKLFKWAFRSIEALWMFVQIVQYLLQIFK